MIGRDELHGVLVPVVTPFLPNGELDLASYTRYVEKLAEHHINGLIINGTTGEAPTVRWDEVVQITRATQQILKEKQRSIPVIIGTGTNDTLTTVQRTEQAAALGADAVLVVVPYYSKPSQEGIIEHFRRVTEVGVPVIAYEIPARTGVRLTMHTAKTIMEMEGVIGMKDSSDGLELVTELTRQDAGAVLCGDDLYYHAKLSQGASGGILASANLYTDIFIEVHDLVQKGRVIEGKRSFDRVVPLIRKLFQEPNPAPIKWVLANQGVIASDHLRLPMTRISQPLQNELAQLLTGIEAAHN
ncbi:4-hydroxy-tetrahydrodipicolinate synthase [Paenibacillus sp. VMFN-D1]|uniref:4-hydroxy-tetrahydrodipicolinate synthase n=1 Tax=Paenibacillus sp. VMFN-D1 TaxID=2135608 RepID=UPI000E25CB90|nr:4-hydroxy-tetrahydrodipicolinate synthase [Paenibacillus sp. VMFN-D1]RED41135.1 4-hydroxy-tetrahydrodipicolinate synthase [Paenibacillus sp. VMFN-D1]